MALERQEYPWWPKMLGNWSKEVRWPYAGRPLPIQLLFLPTYAPWTNPVEKLWRWLEQEVLHLHPFGDDWEGLKAAVAAFLERFRGPSPELLRYVGLSPG